ncbi:MAG: hypothetical protein WAM97_04715 [Acidimicrobiales bacterium]
MFARRSYLIISMACAMTIGLVGASLVSGDAFAAGTTHSNGANIAYGRYYSGYAVISDQTPPSEASAQFKIPAFTSCGRGDQQIGAGVEVEDTSATLIASWVEMGCDKGKVVYQGIFDAYATAEDISFPVTAGQTVAVAATMNEQSSSLSFAVVGGSSQTLVVSNNTAVTTLIGAFPFGTTKSGNPLAVPDFGRISFKDADINGAGVGTYSASGDLYEFIRTTNGKSPSDGGIVQIQPSNVKPASFAVAFEHD